MPETMCDPVRITTRELTRTRYDILLLALRFVEVYVSL